MHACMVRIRTYIYTWDAVRLVRKVREQALRPGQTSSRQKQAADGNL